MWGCMVYICGSMWGGDEEGCKWNLEENVMELLLSHLYVRSGNLT